MSNVWFITGSQHLYGPEVLDTVAERAEEMAQKMNESGLLPCKVVYKVTAKTPEEITQVVKEANYNDACAGIITWMHTFSPSKMWLGGLKELQKPYLNQSLHGLFGHQQQPKLQKTLYVRLLLF